MTREIKKLIFVVSEIYKSTLYFEAQNWVEFARYLPKLRARGYTKPKLCYITDNLNVSRISYAELYKYLKKYDIKTYKKVKRIFL